MISEQNISRTHVNLMRAFAGESQAGNRYRFAANMAEKNGLPVIKALFLYTANQEKEHAEVFYNLLKELHGREITIEAGYPVDHPDSVRELLKLAKEHEYKEYEIIYPQFSAEAKKEGYVKAAAAFDMIAEIEKIHGDRFGRFCDLMEGNCLFASDIETGWICLNCGYVYDGREAPEKCPVCGHEKGYFIRFELSPFETKQSER